jgi:hypothetical protein
VHYNELGQHMGTADLFVDARSAQAILREYGNIAIDGSFPNTNTTDHSTHYLSLIQARRSALPF